MGELERFIARNKGRDISVYEFAQHLGISQQSLGDMLARLRELGQVTVPEVKLVGKLALTAKGLRWLREMQEQVNTQARPRKAR